METGSVNEGDVIDDQSPNDTALHRRWSPILTLGLLFLYTFGPILGALLASGIAHLAGAKLDEGNSHPCIVLGIDLGGILYILFVAAWLALITVPTGLLMMLGYTAFLIGSRMSRRLMNTSDEQRFLNEQFNHQD